MYDSEALLILKRVDERRTVREIAGEFHLSATTIHYRIKALEDMGLVESIGENLARNKQLTDLGRQALEVNKIISIVESKSPE